MPRKKDVAAGKKGVRLCCLFFCWGLFLLGNLGRKKICERGENVRHRIIKVAKDCERVPEAMAFI